MTEVDHIMAMVPQVPFRITPEGTPCLLPAVAKEADSRGIL
jgi:hypothetical protein